MRRWIGGCAVVIAVAGVFVNPATAVDESTTGSTVTVGSTTPAEPRSVVTVLPGPSEQRYVVQECSDVALGVFVSDRFIITRDNSATAITVAYSVAIAVSNTVSPNAVLGPDYQMLFGAIDLATGVDEVAVPVSEPGSPSTHATDVVITLQTGGSYDLGDPASAAAQFIMPRDPALGPVDCNPAFQLVDVPTNHEQTIHVGDTPVRIETTQGDGARVRLVAGELPPGIVPSDDGSGPGFMGSAASVGDFAAQLDVCPWPAFVWTCRSTSLTVHVLASPPNPVSPTVGPAILPETGASDSVLIAVGLGALLCGALMMVQARRRAAV